MADNASITAATTNPAPTADSAPWLLLWQQLLKTWATDGSLTAAAREALQLEHTPALLTELNDAWALGDFADLPPIELLSAADISGALGAYAASTASIYLNSNWLSSASHEQIHAVLTEELGHHLDSLLNTTDTPGDEGELFAAQLQNKELISTTLREQDTTRIKLNNKWVVAEASEINSSHETTGKQSIYFETISEEPIEYIYYLDPSGTIKLEGLNPEAANQYNLIEIQSKRFFDNDGFNRLINTTESNSIITVTSIDKNGTLSINSIGPSKPQNTKGRLLCVVATGLL